MAKSYFKIKSWAEKFALAAMVGAVFAPKALAQGGIQLEQGRISAVPLLDQKPAEIISTILQFVLILAGLLAVFYLIYGGIIYVTAGGDAEKAGKGRVAITNAIIGIVIIAAALVIYNLVVGGLNTGGVS